MTLLETYDELTSRADPRWAPYMRRWTIIAAVWSAATFLGHWVLWPLPMYAAKYTFSKNVSAPRTSFFLFEHHINYYFYSSTLHGWSYQLFGFGELCSLLGSSRLSMAGIRSLSSSRLNGLIRRKGILRGPTHRKEVLLFPFQHRFQKSSLVEDTLRFVCLRGVKATGERGKGRRSNRDEITL